VADLPRPSEAHVAHGPAGDRSPAGPVIPAERLAKIAIVLGCLGIVVGGVVLGIVTAVLASIAGSQARDAGRSLENAYIAFTLAIVDGIVWLVLHMAFNINFLLG
jgi:hypothetical protein